MFMRSFPAVKPNNVQLTTVSEAILDKMNEYEPCFVWSAAKNNVGDILVAVRLDDNLQTQYFMLNQAGHV